MSAEPAACATHVPEYSSSNGSSAVTRPLAERRAATPSSDHSCLTGARFASTITRSATAVVVLVIELISAVNRAAADAPIGSMVEKRKVFGGARPASPVFTGCAAAEVWH